MFKNIIKSVFGDPTEREIAKFRTQVEEINALEPALKKLSDDDLIAKTNELKKRLADGAKTDDVLVEAFALVREASVRTIGLRHFDVQMIGGIVLHQGRIAEMRTGEGKTLVATLPLVLNALMGRGVHLVTPNDYLSKVGVQTMGRIYNKLGLSVAVIQNTGGDPTTGSYLYDQSYQSNDARFQNLRPVTRRDAYHADITYGTNNEFGFDYLRDHMVSDNSQLVQRELFFAIIDEVDNILIDEARTPLIISGQADEPSGLYKVFAKLVKNLQPSSADSIEADEPDGDYIVDEKDRVAFLTEEGVEKIERAMKINRLYDPENAEIIPYLDNSLRAHALFHNEKEYVVQNGEVVIVDEFTGRLMVGRRFSEGLHQAIEAKEGVEIRRENLTLATITFQNYFRMYKKLAGMTGTAMTEAEEFEKIYNLEVTPIPTHRDMIRRDYEDLIYGNEEAKYKAVVDEIRDRSVTGQPVLIGTASIDTSERLSKLLTKSGIKHQVLNAKYHEKEAEIITQAGRLNTVTIATNMAGRGVDILLGGNPEGLAREALKKQGIEITQATTEQWEAELAKAKAQCDIDRLKVIELGGLFVLGTERHEARRIDNQLRGRAGRQGDPGESRFFLSLEDELMRRFGGDRVKGFMKFAGIQPDEPIEAGIVSKAITQAQTKVEGYNFDIRKRVLEYDDVVNKQREVIYRQRREILVREDLRDDYLRVLDEQIAKIVDAHTEHSEDPAEWELTEMHQRLFTLFPVPVALNPETMRGHSLDELEEMIVNAAHQSYDMKTQQIGADLMKRYERAIMLYAIDRHWRRHLTELDVLREGIGLVAIAQRDPLVEYKREAFNMWTTLQDDIQLDAVRNIFRVMPPNVAAAAQAAQRRQALGGVLQQAPSQGQQGENAGAGQPAQGQSGPPRQFMPPSPQILNAVRNIQAVRPTIQAAGTQPAKPEPTQRRAEKRPGRNEPCWCGSGKKYKDCHWKEDQGKLVNRG
ncbi:MAG: preprotein translocase subunit SecA [Pleurocapsa minor GSE-CHR-MK-17-07R]|jgi:preprotein translocase subunit SecA|nr:preprotein translocase subunit SecA [Pleurocapsa minor GSE-CHR-MK 17-07R]